MLAIALVILLAPPGGTGADLPADLALQVALRELTDVPRDINTKASLCVALGEPGISDEQLRSLRASVPGLSLKRYTIDCLTPVTEFLSVRVWQQERKGPIKVFAQWSRKSDDYTCFSDGLRRRVYEAWPSGGGWHLTSFKDENPSSGTPKP